GFLLASVLDNLTAAVTIETIDAFDGLPDAVVVTVILFGQLLAWLIPLGVLVALLAKRRYRRLGLIVFSGLIAVALSWGINSQLISQFQPPSLEISQPGWICTDAERTEGLPELSTVGGATEAPGALFSSQACVPGDAFPNTVYLAGFAAALGALTPWLKRRWRRAAWAALLLFLLVRTLDGVVVAVDALFALALGYAIGAATDLIFGSPQRTPTADELRETLNSRGLDISGVEPAVVRARSSTPYRGTTDDGESFFLKVLGPDERAGDLLFRLYRMARFKGFGDERPASSLRRAVEHEAVMSMSASNEGVRTPRLMTMSEVGVDSMVLAFEEVAGETVATVDGSRVTADVQAEIWRQVAVMRRHRMAHRNLGPHNIILDADDRPWLLDYGFAEISATDGELRNDVAELLVALAAKTDAQTAIAGVTEGLGVEALSDAATRLQPHALGSGTRELLKGRKGLLKELREGVIEATGLEGIELEPLERVKPGAILMLITLGLVFYLLIPQLAEVDLATIADADWSFLPFIIVFSLATYLAAAIAMAGAVPERIRFVEMFFAQMAASFFNRISPVKVGGMAANVRYLQKAGIDPAIAVSSVGVNNVAGFVVHITLTLIFVATAGRNASESFSLPSGLTVLYVLVGVLTMAGVVMVIPWGRRFFLRRVWPILKRSAAGIGAVVQSPVRMAMLFGGAALISGAYILTLWYSVEAFGGGVGFVSVGAVFLAGTAVANAAPAPGGVGAAEAALIAGLTAFGLEPEVAVPAVFLYRIATFWLPVLPGWLAYRALAKRGAF
ncbi:MAG: flippase-like domain-containing protein, partial [Acidimicrobiia bacterium]|nr:flippase-like domain-containing protein [Acidimicrobiia bacterium]